MENPHIGSGFNYVILSSPVSPRTKYVGLLITTAELKLGCLLLIVLY